MTELPRITRLAPSPTGGLHLGNARTFLINWALARQLNWRIAMRIDDLDSPRVRPGAAEGAIDDLKWLGIDWDTPIDFQSARLTHYREALFQLAREGKIYPCRCTRSQIANRIASAPNEGDHELRYPGTCRPATLTKMDFNSSAIQGCSWRFRLPSPAIRFHDNVYGPQTVSVDQEVGDFLVANKLGTASYQLAVNLDDNAVGVTDIIRGDDLLSSTGRQLMIREALGLPTSLVYWHLPLVVGPDGLRLAKRHGATRISELRSLGVRPERIIGLVAHWSGISPRQEMDLESFRKSFSLDSLPRKRIVLTPSDLEWLGTSAAGNK